MIVFSQLEISIRVTGSASANQLEIPAILEPMVHSEAYFLYDLCNSHTILK